MQTTKTTSTRAAGTARKSSGGHSWKVFLLLFFEHAKRPKYIFWTLIQDDSVILVARLAEM